MKREFHAHCTVLRIQHLSKIVAAWERQKPLKKEYPILPFPASHRREKFQNTALARMDSFLIFDKEKRTCTA